MGKIAEENSLSRNLVLEQRAFYIKKKWCNTIKNLKQKNVKLNPKFYKQPVQKC